MKCCQMDSEKFPSEERLSSDLFKYYFEVSSLFTVFLSGPSIWQRGKPDFQTHYAIGKFPSDRISSPKAQHTSGFEGSAELVFFVECTRPRFSDCTPKGGNSMEKSVRNVSRTRAVNVTLAGPLNSWHQMFSDTQTKVCCCWGPLVWQV